ncbi:MAG: DUF58 domain-containing protein [Roseiflexaceae bacterium]|nr:DUF58 domain-containing protein [Roseiflexaceae bacterium]
MDDLFWLTSLLLVVAVLLRSEFFFYLLYVVIGLQVLTRLWLRRIATRLSWRRELLPAAFPGEPLTVTLEVTNQSLLPLPWLALHESIPPALHTPPMVREVFSLGAGEQRILRYTLVGRQRGYYRLGPLTLSTGDVLGLRERTIVAPATDALTIYPKLLPLHELGLPATLPYGTLAAQQRLFSDPARPAGVRPYQPADGVRRIDWKSSAHSGTPLVRSYQPAIAMETLIALAFSREEFGKLFAYDLMERALVAAASIAGHLSAQGQPVGLCSTGTDPASGVAPAVPVGNGRAHLIEVLGALGRLEIAQAGSLITTLPRATAQLGWGSTLVVITGQRGSELVAALLPLRRRGLNIALVLSEPTPEDLALPRAHGISAYALWRDGRPTTAVGAGFTPIPTPPQPPPQ